ncbi:MAG: site-specific integrase [Acidimicrobiales bacterium]
MPFREGVADLEDPHHSLREGRFRVFAALNPTTARETAGLELYVRHLEEAGLAPSTIDRRISTICGFYRFAHVDGVIGTNPAEYVRRPKVHPSESRTPDIERKRP